MEVILYLNNVYYRTIEVPDHRPVIYWSVPFTLRNNKYPMLCRFDYEDHQIIEFHHCDLGYYYCHVSVEQEEIIRAV